MFVFVFMSKSPWCKPGALFMRNYFINALPNLIAPVLAMVAA